MVERGKEEVETEVKLTDNFDEHTGSLLHRNNWKCASRQARFLNFRLAVRRCIATTHALVQVAHALAGPLHGNLALVR